MWPSHPVKNLENWAGSIFSLLHSLNQKLPRLPLNTWQSRGEARRRASSLKSWLPCTRMDGVREACVWKIFWAFSFTGCLTNTVTHSGLLWSTLKVSVLLLECWNFVLTSPDINKFLSLSEDCALWGSLNVSLTYACQTKTTHFTDYIS